MHTRISIDPDHVSRAIGGTGFARNASPLGSAGVTESILVHRGDFPDRHSIVYIFPYANTPFEEWINDAFEFEAAAWRAYWTELEVALELFRAPAPGAPPQAPVLTAVPLLGDLETAIFRANYTPLGSEASLPMLVRPYVEWPQAESLAELRGEAAIAKLHGLLNRIWARLHQEGYLPSPTEHLSLDSLAEGFAEPWHLLSDGDQVVPTQFRLFHADFRRIRRNRARPRHINTQPVQRSSSPGPYTSASSLGPDGDFLADTVRGIDSHSVFKDTISEIMALSNRILRDAQRTVATSQRLREHGQRGTLQSAMAYLGEWERQENLLRRGLNLLTVFMTGAAKLIDRPGSIEDRVQSVMQLPEYQSVQSPDSTRWKPGFQAWKLLCSKIPAAPRPDGGAAAGHQAQGGMFRQIVQPWIALAQFLEEALPVEVPVLPRTDPGHQSTAQHVASALGFEVSPIPLYHPTRVASHYEGTNIDIQPAPPGTVFHDLPAHPTTHDGAVVRVQFPHLMRAPSGQGQPSRIWVLHSG
ncbi:MAG: hypothetical protein AAGA48_08610 [Myxococcota bacterium]